MSRAKLPDARSRASKPAYSVGREWRRDLVDQPDLVSLEGRGQPTIVCQHTAQPALLTRLRMPLAEVSASLARALERLLGVARLQGVSRSGYPFLAVHELTSLSADLEIGLPVSGTPKEAENAHPGSIPAGRYLTFAHCERDLPLLTEFHAMQAWLRAHAEHTNGPLYAVVSRERVSASGDHGLLLQRRIVAGGAASHAHDLATGALTDEAWAPLAAAIQELARLSLMLAPIPSVVPEAPEAPTGQPSTRPGELLRVRDAMTKEVVSCRATDTGLRAAQLLWEHDVGALPVVDTKGRPVAMVTDRDLCMAAYTQGKKLQDVVVSSAMSQQIQVCRPEQPLSEAERSMAAYQVRRLPVVNARGTLVGMLSVNDIAQLRAEVSGQEPIEANPDSTSATLAAISRHRLGGLSDRSQSRPAAAQTN
jgi:CBS domain-containing protein